MIGIFDSGFGGLTVLREWEKIAPQYDIIFLGDSARTPYGSRSVETITKFTDEGVKWLLEHGAKVILIACNTASAEALVHVQAAHSEKEIIGAITPAAEEALQKTRLGRIGIIGTRGTVLARSYEREIERLTSTGYRYDVRRLGRQPATFSVAAPLLVPLVEEGWIEEPETRTILRKYLRPLKAAGVDTLILGCTHYPLLEEHFVSEMNGTSEIINSGAALARKFAEELKQNLQLETQLPKNALRTFFTTDCPRRFRFFGSRFLGRDIDEEAVKKT